jgi:hypothetical protein
MGLHTADKILLKTEDLPWAHPIMPINSASMNGIGWSPTGVVQGSTVLIVFLDEYQQQPIMLGTIGGISQTKSAKLISDMSNGVITTDADGELVSSTGTILTGIVTSIADMTNSSDGTDTVLGSKYKVKAINMISSEGTSITYNVVDLSEINTMATATFDESTGLYLVILLNPETYNVDQYSPFSGNGKTFSSTQEIATYFDNNFEN